MFPYQLQHTLAYINYGYYGAPSGTPSSSPYSAPASKEYQGDPTTVPFPWFAWNNRPFCSPMELMLVPALSSSQLLYNYNVIGNPFPSSNPIPSNPAPTNPPTQESYYPGGRHQPLHLRQRSVWAVAQLLPLAAAAVAQQRRLPPRRSSTASSSISACPRGSWARKSRSIRPRNSPAIQEAERTSSIRPTIASRAYRDPGRINLNTLVVGANDGVVWNGLMQSCAGPCQQSPGFRRLPFQPQGLRIGQQPGGFRRDGDRDEPQFPHPLRQSFPLL